MKSENTTLYFREGSSDKVYQACLEQKNGAWVVNFAFGRRGATLQTGTKTTTPIPFERAKDIYDKLVSEKTAKGYTPGSNGTPYQHSDNAERVSGLLPQLLNPIDAAAAERLLNDLAWWMQEKKDGMRVLIRKEGSEVTGINRKGLTIGLPNRIIAHSRALSGSFIIDGECVGDTLHAFDCLARDGADLTSRPYSQRYHALITFVKNKGNILCIPTAAGPGDKRDLLKFLQQERKEGVVFKLRDAPYTPGRPSSGGSQLKHKFYATASLLVARVNDKRSVALELFANKKERVEAGNVTIPPNQPIPKEGTVVEVRYLYAYKESGRLYQPTYLGVRGDIEPRACTTAQIKYRTPSEEDEA